MTPQRVDALLKKYRGRLKPGDTPAKFAAREGTGPKFTRDIFAAFRKAGVLELSKHDYRTPRGVHPPADDGEPPAPPPLDGTQPPMVDVGPDGTAHAYSVDTRIRTPEELVAAADLDLDRWEIVKSKVNSWPVAMKIDGESEPRVTRLWQVSLDLRPRLVPLAPLTDWLPPPPFDLGVSEEPPEGLRRAVFLPDAQIGYRWVFSGASPYLEPTHDRAAIDAALQVLALSGATDVVLLGDMLDLAPLSTRWPVDDSMRQVTRLALLEWRWLLHRIREVAGSARVVYLEGNHEERWSKFLAERAGELVDVVPSLPGVLGLADLGIEWVPYRSQVWLWGRVRLVHGEVVRQGGGATAAAVLARETHSTVYGHIHRAEVAHRRVTGPEGEGYLWAMSPGCLCRTDGAVPGSTPRSDWQQGVGEVVAVEGLPDAVSALRIANGRVLYRGDVIVGRDYTDLLVESSGVTAYRRSDAS